MKKGLKYLTFLVLLAALSSCVGNKKLVYLQDKEAKGDERYSSDATMNSNPSQYVLQVNDVLYINMEKFVVGEEIFSVSSFEQVNRLSQIQHPYIIGHRIKQDSTITLPILGLVKAAGKTLDELQRELRLSASKQFPGSEVEIFQLDGTVSILGEVNNPGRYPIYKNRNTIFDLIAIAGDLKDYANRSEIKVVREENGVQKVFHLDLNDLNALTSGGFYLTNNDIIIVSPLKRRKYVTTNIQWLVSSVTALVAIVSLVVTITR